MSKIKSFFSEFKQFALKGNVLDLAVGVIIGAAFKDIVTSLTDNLINPILLLFTAGARYSWQDIGHYLSNFVTSVVNFLIMAFILFCIVKAVNKMMSLGKKEPEQVAEPARLCPFCKSEIAPDAVRCPHCTSQLEAAPAADGAAEAVKS